MLKREEEALRHSRAEERRKEEAEKRKKMEEAKDAARKKAEELRQREAEEEEAGRRARELQRKQALEELQRVKRLSQVAISDLKNLSNGEDKENIPKSSTSELLPADSVEQKSKEEQKRLSTYNAVRNLDEIDTAYVKEAESVVAASRKAREEALNVKQRIESNMSQLRLSTLEGDDQGAVYYGMGSTARRSSKDIDNFKRESIINDDLADEVEAIRLAADFTSRRLLNEQKKDSGSSASSSRLRIRALLDKQKTQRDDDEKIRKEKRESQDVSKFLWIYR